MTWPRRVLVLHNRYKHHGGEDVVVQRETELLKEAGHQVELLVMDNAEDGAGNPISALSALRALVDSAWSWTSYERVYALCRSWTPDIVHLHNFWFRLTPSVFSGVRDAGCPLVVTLHNFRALCPAGVMMRDNKPCQLCLGKFPWRGIAYRCYHNSAIASSSVARMTSGARRRGLWHQGVNLYLAPSAWTRETYIKGGFPGDRIAIHPHFLPAPLNTNRQQNSDNILYVGRLAPEKGIQILLSAWRQARRPAQAQLLLVGGGPLLATLQANQALKGENIRVIGEVAAPDVGTYLMQGAAVVQPSTCYETFGLSILEGFSHGKPAIASRIGALPELVRDTQNGFLVAPGNSTELARAMERFWSDDSLRLQMAENALKTHSELYQAEQAYPRLVDNYRRARKRLVSG